ncbi:M23 family metallopeptidase [Streptomyces sp. ACA25]|uniref:M23 family metallopeptidase n=1 Tax=Streptomyces sp. ACA25 TaxID=3022596 RepID=UPI002306E128|nr:M23 family metallopeptidase [Streptomyces sp. ACA25]MDB1086721.1 M23 family metallopeptidase [Streptomyces sp. ACA25]
MPRQKQILRALRAGFLGALVCGMTGTLLIAGHGSVPAATRPSPPGAVPAPGTWTGPAGLAADTAGRNEPIAPRLGDLFPGDPRPGPWGPEDLHPGGRHPAAELPPPPYPPSGTAPGQFRPEAGGVRGGPGDEDGTPHVHPVPGHPVSAPYGIPGSWLAGRHTGVDFATPIGVPVLSVGPGKVVEAGRSEFYGNVVIIRMADGIHALYAHLSRISVRKGERVEAGAPAGLTGNTGRSTGPHLHFEIRTGREYGTDVDPLAYLRDRGVQDL